MSMTFLISKQSNDIIVNYTTDSSDIFKSGHGLDGMHAFISDALSSNHKIELKFESDPWLEFDSEIEDYEEQISRSIKAIHGDVLVEFKPQALPEWMEYVDTCDSDNDDEDYG